MRCSSVLLLQPYLHLSLVLGAGSPSQGMGSHQCCEPGLSHTEELRTGARVQGLQESPHPSVTALTAGRTVVAPETQVSCKSSATTRPGGLREGCRRSLLSAAGASHPTRWDPQRGSSPGCVSNLSQQVGVSCRPRRLEVNRIPQRTWKYLDAYQG